MNKFIVMLIFSFLKFPAVSHSQIISTVVGTGVSGYNGDGILATNARLNRPVGVFVDSSGEIYLSELFNYRVRKVDTSGFITTIAGNGIGGAYSGDGGPATAAVFPSVGGLWVQQSQVYVCFPNPTSERVSTFVVSGTISTFAGNGIVGFTGDGGAATAAQCTPRDVECDRHGNVFISMGSGQIRKVNSDGVISTVAGTSTTGAASGDGGAATAAVIGAIHGLAISRDGSIYLVDPANYRVRLVNTSGIITTIGGNGTNGYSGDGGAATMAQISQLSDVEVDGLGNIYLADRFNHAVRKIDVSGIISTIAGNGSVGYSGDGGPATAAQLNQPFYISLHPNGDIYFTEQFNHVVRKIAYGNHIPVFTGGHIQSLSVCENGSLVLNTALAVSDADAGQTLSWTLITPPLHGAAVASYTATATGGTVIPAGLSYTPAAGYAGTDTFEVRADDGRSVAIVTFYVNVLPLPAAAIAGADTLCVGDTATLHGSVAGGVWSSSSTAVVTVSATGLCSAVAAGTGIISYTVSNSCGSDTDMHTLAILPVGACETTVPGKSQQRYSVYPNPGRGEFSLSLPEGVAGDMTITDVAGRVVMQRSVQNGAAIAIEESGVYMIAITTEAGVWRGKVVVVE